MSFSYLDLHLEIDSEDRLRTKLYDKIDHFNFPIVNFPFMCSNILAAPAHGVYVSQLIRYSTACGSYNDFHNICFLLVKLKSSFRKFYGRYHALGTKYFCYKWSWIICSFIVIEIRAFPHLSLITGVVTRRVQHVEQELIILLEHIVFIPEF